MAGISRRLMRFVGITKVFFLLGAVAVLASIDSEAGGSAVLAHASNQTSEDWQEMPTFGRSWDYSQAVDGGLEINGRSYDITDNYHLEFERLEAGIGDANTLKVKIHSTYQMERFVLHLGVPEISRATDSESEIHVMLLPDYSADGYHVIAGIEHVQDEELVDEGYTSASLAGVPCSTYETPVCLEVTLDFRVLGHLSHDVAAISAIDQQRRSVTTYVNDGIAFTGEPLTGPETAVLSARGGNQHGVETLHLTRDDRRGNTWYDQYGDAWIRNGYGSWFLADGQPGRDAYEARQKDLASIYLGF